MQGAWESMDKYKGGHVADEVPAEVGTAVHQALEKYTEPMTLKDAIKALVDLMDEVGNLPIKFRGENLLGHPVYKEPTFTYNTDEDWIDVT